MVFAGHRQAGSTPPRDGPGHGDRLATVMSLVPPGYELVEELGRGPMGTVHLARHAALGRVVVVKRIVGGASSQDPETVLRFERETRLLATLDHPGIVRVHELVRAGADLFIVMEHVPGTDLRRTLAAGAPRPADAARYVGDIAAALDHAHARGVVHRAVKPSNVLVRTDGAVKVTDFGLAALLERQATSRTGPAEAVGGLAYLAPELARGDLAVDRRADVYSLGVIAYEMLVGRPPFPLDPNDPYATVRAQMEEPPPRPGSLVPGFPPLLEAALLWALQKPAERRPATAGELAAAVREGLDRPPTIGAYK
jgi:serine/threonine protein kinase